MQQIVRNLVEHARRLPKEVAAWCLVDGRAGIYAWPTFFDRFGWPEAAEAVNPDRCPEWPEEVDHFLGQLNEALADHGLCVVQGESGDIFVCRSRPLATAKVEELSAPGYQLVTDSREVAELANRTGLAVIVDETPTAAIVKAADEEVWFSWDAAPYSHGAEFERWV